MTVSHVDSWYAASANPFAAQPSLQENLDVDVCVLGAGLTGLSAALELARKGYSVVVLEAAITAWGASGRSGGQMIFGFAAEQPAIEASVGKDNAKLIWQAGLDGMDLVRERIREHNIDCDFVDGHTHVAIKQRQARELQHWKSSLEKDYGYQSLEFLDQQQIREHVASDRYVAGLYDSNSGHLHPLNYTLGLAQACLDAGVRIFENSAVTRIEQGEPVKVHTASGMVRSRFMVVAGNAYLNGLLPGIENRVMPVGTYICATEPLGEQRCRELIRNNSAVADINFVLDYFRCSGDHRMLFGGRVSYSTLQPANLAATMGKRMVDVFPQLADAKVEYAWGGFVAITVSREPNFGRIGNNIYYAQGFSGHGIAATGLAGKLMAEAISGTAETFDVFSKISHLPFPGGRLFRMPMLVLAMAWFRLMDLRP